MRVINQPHTLVFLCRTKSVPSTMTVREQIQRIHTLDTLPTSYKRKLRVLRSLYLNPLQSFTQLKEGLKTHSDISVRPIVNSLLNDGFISQCKKPYFVVALNAYRVFVVYKITKKGETTLIEQVLD